jgi:hypothetical protein
MYKTLTVAALLLAAFAFTSGSRSADASPVTAISPPIVARGKVLNQTAPIPTTTIFTPTQSGLYRLSVYGTITQGSGAGTSFWIYSPAWIDDSGLLQNSANGILESNNDGAGSFLLTNSGFSLGATITLEAKAGTPITYSVTQVGPPDNSAYSLYYTLERLE